MENRSEDSERPELYTTYNIRIHAPPTDAGTYNIHAPPTDAGTYNIHAPPTGTCTYAKANDQPHLHMRTC